MKASILIAALMAFATILLAAFIVSSLAAWLCFAAAAILCVAVLIDGLRKGPFYREEVRRSRYPVLSTLIFIVPIFSSLFIFVEESIQTVEWYRPVMLSSFTILFFINMLSLPLSVLTKHREESLEKKQPVILPVSVIIPAYNEEKWIGHCIEAVLESDYPSKEIIVVDDGSTDRTYEIALRYRDKGVTVLRKPNGGKASALNYGMLFASGSIIVSIDADTIINRHALTYLVKSFEDPNVVGVAGNVRVVNRVNWLTKNQALEYVTQINIVRRATSFFGVVQVMPGPLAAFRKSYADAVGKYDKATITEDFDITVKLLKTGGVIQSHSKAIAYTEAPLNISSLYKQRLRWYRGNTQVLLRHRDALRNPKYGFLNLLVFPLLVIQQIIAPTLGVIAIPAAAIVILNGGLAYVLLLWAVFILLQSFLSLMALDIEGDDVRQVLYAPFAVLGYKQLLDIIAFKSVIDVLVLRRRPKWTSAQKVGLKAAVSD
ncbi:MAG: glycosyltransferase family 2 protein [Candidatus Caldarchaeum sp.]|nr:glycosyltransferase family 2 protein [Candidatus Caldarchaeum sp.]MDW7977679.1 glycosyltransferase [Candidatus Caldarchaeum sp.]MDW8360117.1 glycosyltransferase [Candidatus Caldarchaeum sp.]